MSELNLPLMFDRLSEGQLAALHAVDGFVAGVEARGSRPLHYGPLFQKLMNSVVELIPADDDTTSRPVPPNPGPEAKPAEHGAPPVAGNDQVSHMVDRFLSWRLPEFFNPDGGITFEAVGNKGTPYEYTREPSGTNLFDAAQAEEMVRYMLVGLSGTPDAPPEAASDAAPSPQHLEAEVALSAIREALAPLGPWLVHLRDREDGSIYWNKYDAGVLDSYAEVLMGDFRRVFRAAGMFTLEMQAPQPLDPPGPAEQAEVQPPPPATSSDEESASAAIVF